MIKIIKYLAIFILIFSCKNTNEDKISVIEKKETNGATTKIRNFNLEKKLMMNFYSGMNREEVKKALEYNISDSKFFVKNKNWNSEVWKLERKHLDPISKENIDSAQFFNSPFNQSDILYAFSTGSKTYYSDFQFQFKPTSGLEKINIIVQTGTRLDKQYKSSIEKEFEEIKNLNTTIVNLYTKKYGNPEIRTGSYIEIEDDFNKILGFYGYKENVDLLESTFIFSDENSRIEITLSFNYIKITYGTLLEYLQNKKNDKKNDQIKEEFENNSFKETFDDI